MPDDGGPVDQECVEGYLFTGRPPRFLLLRRPPERGRYWVPVGGKVEAGDPDLPAALRREVAEETGITELARVFALGWVIPFPGPDGGRWRLHAYGVELDVEIDPRLSHEHDAFEWVDETEARFRLHYEDNRGAVSRLVELIAPGAPFGSPPTV